MPSLLFMLFPLPLLLIPVDVFIDKHDAFLRWSGSQWGVWAMGMAWDLSAWACLGVVLALLASSGRRFPGRVGHVLVWTSAAVHSFAIAVSAGYHAAFHNLPNVHALRFMIDETHNAWAMFVDAFTIWGALWFCLSIPAFVWIHVVSRDAWMRILPTRRGWGLRLAISAPFLVAAGVSSFALGWHRFQEPLPLTAAWSRVFFQYGLQAAGNRTDLQRPVRMSIVPPAKPGPGVNILVVLHESLRADGLERLPDSLHGALFADSLAPRSLRWQADSNTWVFPYARSNATATAVSVSSWTTGVPPWASTYQIHRSPTLWDAAHAAGRRTFLLTAQDWNWWHLDEFFFGPSLNRVVDRSSFDAPRVNDLGVDDGLLVDSLVALAKESKTPFTGVLQFNANHGPYYAPGHMDLPHSTRERYAASVAFIDSIQDACFRALDRAGVLENTLLIVVSDHGENLGVRSIARINDFHEESVRIPFWIRLPRGSLRDARIREALDQWVRRPVDLLDVAPTILDVLGYAPDAPERALMTGSSLLRPPPATERILGGQSTGDVRAWDVEGGYAVRGMEKFVFHGGRGPALFDLSADPGERTNLWTDPVRKARALPWLREAFTHPGRAALCRRARGDCPEELRDLDRPGRRARAASATPQGASAGVD